MIDAPLGHEGPDEISLKEGIKLLHALVKKEGFTDQATMDDEEKTAFAKKFGEDVKKWMSNSWPMLATFIKMGNYKATVLNYIQPNNVEEESD